MWYRIIIDRPLSPPKPRLSERALPFANSTPSTRTASLPPSPPSNTKRKLFWVLPIHRSLVPSPPLVRAPLPNRRPSPPPVPFPSTYRHVPIANSLNYMLIHLPLPLPIRSSPPLTRSDLPLIRTSHFTPYPCTCLSSLPSPLSLLPRYSLSPSSDGPSAPHHPADAPSPLLPQAYPLTPTWVTHIASDLSVRLNER